MAELNFKSACELTALTGGNCFGHIARRCMMVNDGIERDVAFQGMPAGLGLAVHHDHRFIGIPMDLVNRFQFEIEQLDHGA